MHDILRRFDMHVCMRAQDWASSSVCLCGIQSLFFICFLGKNHKRIHQDSPSRLFIYVTCMCERNPLLVPWAQPDPSHVNSGTTSVLLLFFPHHFLLKTSTCISHLMDLIKPSKHWQNKGMSGKTSLNALSKGRMCTNTPTANYTCSPQCTEVEQADAESRLHKA